VCKRLQALCLKPELLHSVSVRIERPTTALSRLRALYDFLASPSAQQIERLKLVSSNLSSLQDSVRQEAYALLPACLAACACTQSLLRELTLDGRPIACTAWLAGFTALQRLTVRTEDELHIPAGISRLQLLEEAHLKGHPLDWGAVVQLPACLRLLHLDDGYMRHSVLPSQLSLRCLPACLLACPAAHLPACLLDQWQSRSG